jgi:hypothetical protein
MKKIKNLLFKKIKYMLKIIKMKFINIKQNGEIKTNLKFKNNKKNIEIKTKKN